MSSRIRGRVIMIAEVLSPLRHGDGVVGNVQTFRRRRVWVDGAPEEVPFVSGNSIKHWLRENGALFALQAAGLDDGRLTRDQVQLLFSGGMLSSGGQTVKLTEARRLADLVSILSLHGYAAGNVMTSSQVRVDHLTVACKECERQTLAPLQAYAPEYLPMLSRRGESFVEAEFGTRHVAERREHVHALLDQEEAAASIKAATDEDKSTQMIFEFETLTPGAVLVGGVSFPHGVTQRELQSFRSALTYGSEGVDDKGRLLMRFGAGVASGYGLCAVSLHGELAVGIEAWRHAPTDELVPTRAEGDDYDADLGAYVEHLREHADEVQEAMEALL